MNKFAGIISGRSIQKRHEIERMLTPMVLPRKLSSPSFVNFENFIVATTDQPFHQNATGSLLLAIDGYQVNVEKIKKKLVEDGQVVTSDNTLEILMLSYLTWGAKAFQYWDGPFSVVILDKKQKKIILARDRLGSKPLFWGKVGSSFVFASSLKGILASNLVAQAPDVSAIASYFFLGYFPQDKTPIRTISRLLPGYFLEINHDQNIMINKYWSFKSHDSFSHSQSQEEVNEQLNELLSKAIDDRLKLTENHACLLTSDVGSTSLLHLINKSSFPNTNCYSFSFQQGDFIKTKYCERDAKHYNYGHSSTVITPDNIFDNLQHIVWHLDEPVADPFSAGIWRIAQSCKEKNQGIFSALGSYELLGSQIAHGEIPYEPMYIWFLYLTKPFFLKGLIPIFSRLNKRLSFNTLRFFQRDFWALEYIRQHALFSERSFKRVAPKMHGLFDIHIFLQQSYQYLKFILFQNFDIEDYLFFDAETSLSNSLLLQYERLFSAADVSFHSPFFDGQVIDYLFSTPEKFKYRGKRIGTPLYDLLKNDFAPNQLLGFKERSPWFLKDWNKNPKVKEIFKMLPKGVLVESNIIDGKNLQKVIDKDIWKFHQFERLWAILVLEIWFHLFVNNPIYTYPDEDQSLLDFLRAQQPFLL